MKKIEKKSKKKRKKFEKMSIHIYINLDRIEVLYLFLRGKKFY